MANSLSRSKSLQDLQAIKQTIRQNAEQAALEAKAALEAERRRLAANDLFARAVGKVEPLRVAERKHPFAAAVPPVPVQRQRDEQAVLQSSLSDEFDSSSLLETDTHLSFRRPGVGEDVTRKLRRGDWAIQRQIDLHGLRIEQAREALATFIRTAHRDGVRCVRVVHGKGLGSPGKTPVLKSKVHSWLAQKIQVLAFVQARPIDGGAGALLVLLQAVSSR